MRTLYKTAVSTFAIWLLFISVVFADAAPGDEIVTLGDDLSPQQRETLLNEMNVNEDEVLIVTVTNEEEHQYLGDYISASVIGSNALSSSKITLLDQGEGVDVETNRITWVSEGMYANALITAGVKDANIYVTAPFNVSGTGALTGLIKAYEASTDEVIPEDQKQVANEELVKTAELSDEYGVEDATELMARIKEALAEENIETEEDLRALIQRIAGELGMTLTDEELNGLVSLFNRMKDLNIDWDQVQNQIGKIRENIGDFLSSEEGQGFIQSILDFISNLIDIVKGWFSS
ncbi:DUF1002 domain-containing protein [Salipaludibacillus agaradhaerens]|uniref:DUF1002 domain-containing protein n=1 Tax=Salipaludibacillus agaradhaerens TaxID=76935 RepID=UPI002151865E|nr:DUF1002 domain-containing protein [Salipaludibacillus agaradhaerens]MCR6106353.1 DUF1002 domain-containing protein [Salipaludibacillus agaradhaerens]MCR6118386.1 DUF1002 domain-containing protein [Salipaludibacillus agaradhaerens]UJW57492.1 DUF1002 domain-containing protein [Bacillus sp. A116_S68]